MTEIGVEFSLFTIHYSLFIIHYSLKMLLVKNKKAYFDYEILKEYTAGISLTGGEVRSCREKQINLKGSYISISDRGLFLKWATISKFKFDQTLDVDTKRDRLILLNTSEIDKIKREMNTAGVTLIPLSIFTLWRLIKLKVAIARGKKMYDKRETIKKRDLDRRKIR